MISGLSRKFSAAFIKFMPREEQMRNNIRFSEFPDVALILDCMVQEVL
jgi:hypothetical protein